MDYYSRQLVRQLYDLEGYNWYDPLYYNYDYRSITLFHRHSAFPPTLLVFIIYLFFLSDFPHYYPILSLTSPTFPIFPTSYPNPSSVAHLITWLNPPRYHI